MDNEIAEMLSRVVFRVVLIIMLMVISHDLNGIRDSIKTCQTTYLAQSK